jgi:hypothetical protein
MIRAREVCMEHDPMSGPLIDESRWRGANLTAILGTTAVVAGALLLVAGWYGVSGESVVALQLPYIASATVPGAALLIVGAILLAPVLRGDGTRNDSLDRLVELLTEPVPADAGTGAAGAAPADEGEVPDTRLLAVPDGSQYHRAGCALVLGKPEATAVDTSVVAERALQPCPVCRPDPPSGTDVAA